MSDYSKYECLRIEKAGKLATVTLNRGETHRLSISFPSAEPPLPAVEVDLSIP